MGVSHALMMCWCLSVLVSLYPSCFAGVSLNGCLSAPHDVLVSLCAGVSLPLMFCWCLSVLGSLSPSCFAGVSLCCVSLPLMLVSLCAGVTLPLMFCWCLSEWVSLFPPCSAGVSLNGCLSPPRAGLSLCRCSLCGPWVGWRCRRRACFQGGAA